MERAVGADRPAGECAPHAVSSQAVWSRAVRPHAVPAPGATGCLATEGAATAPSSPVARCPDPPSREGWRASPRMASGWWAGPGLAERCLAEKDAREGPGRIGVAARPEGEEPPLRAGARVRQWRRSSSAGSRAALACAGPGAKLRRRDGRRHLGCSPREVNPAACVRDVRAPCDAPRGERRAFCSPNRRGARASTPRPFVAPMESGSR